MRWHFDWNKQSAKWDKSNCGKSTTPMITCNSLTIKLSNIRKSLARLLQSYIDDIQALTELIRKKAVELAAANDLRVIVKPENIMQGIYVAGEHQRMVGDMARKHGMIQVDQDKLITWQDVTRKKLDKYYGLGATDKVLKNLFSDRWFCQSVKRVSRSA